MDIPQNPISPPLPALPPPSPAPPRSFPSSRPAVPNSWNEQTRARRAQHARRPSRAERYEAVVDSARETLQRAQHHPTIGLGIDSPTNESVNMDEWRDTVSSLVQVVDGMARQLATHDELAAQLKIAQSNLTLAETHSEFLEETLKRRESRGSASMISRHSSSGGPLPASAQTNGVERTEGSTTLFGLNLEGHGSSSFFRMPSKRKQTPSTTSNASSTTSLPPAGMRPLRASSSSPRQRDFPPLDPPSSQSFAADGHHSPREPETRSVQQLSAEIFSLQSQVSTLEQHCSGLDATNASLRRSADVLASKCAELEKTKDDLMAELENLSMELFQEANTMVADERKNRAKAEEEVTRMRTEIETLTRDLDNLRQASADDIRRASMGSSQTVQPPLPSPVGTVQQSRMVASSPALPHLPESDSPATNSPDPDSVSLSSASSRKWFAFGRADSTKKSRSSGESDHIQASPTVSNGAADSLAPPKAQNMARVESTGSLRSLSSAASSFFSATSSGRPQMEADHGRGKSSLDDEERSLLSGDRDEMDLKTPLAATGSRPRPSVTQSLPSSPMLDARAQSPSLTIDTSNLKARQPYQPRASSPLLAGTSAFSPDSAPSPGFAQVQSPHDIAPPPRASTSRSPRPHALAAQSLHGDRSRPIAIHSFEGEKAAKSPKSPNERRWEKLANTIPSPTLPSTDTAGPSPRIRAEFLQVDTAPLSVRSVPRGATEAGPSRDADDQRARTRDQAREEARERDRERAAAAREPYRAPSSSRPSDIPPRQPDRPTVNGTGPRNEQRRPQPLQLDPRATAPLVPRAPSPAGHSRPSGTSSQPNTAPNSANPASRPTFLRTASARSNNSSNMFALPSPTYSLNSNGGPGGMSNSSSSQSLSRNPGEDLDNLLKNLADMSASLFGDDDGDDEEEVVGTADKGEARSLTSGQGPVGGRRNGAA